jgi:methyl-accepting chemotaxis protein
MTSNFRIPARTAAVSLGGFVALIGGLVLLGWWRDWTFFKSVFPELVSMKPNSAVGFLFGGVALTLLAPSTAGSRRRALGLVLSVATLAIGALTIAQYVLAVDSGIDEILFRDVEPRATSQPGRMSPNAAVAFMASGASLILLSLRPAHSQIMALVVGGIGALGLLGYAYGVAALYGIGPHTHMAIHTAATFVILSAGLLAVRTEHGLMAIVTSPTLAGALLRKLIPASLVIFGVLGFLRIEWERIGWVDPRTGLALMVVLSIALFAGAIGLAARDLLKTERKIVTV